MALKAALRLGDKVAGLVLLEPNPFYLLSQHKRQAAYEEAKALRDHIKQYGAIGDWHKVAKRFADYWYCEGTWESLPAKRRSAFLEAIPPNFHEWDAVMNEATTIEAWASLKVIDIGRVCCRYKTADSGNCRVICRCLRALVL